MRPLFKFMTKSRDFDVYNRVKILSLLKEYNGMTTSQLAAKINISRPAIYKHLEDLKIRGLIYMDEPDKTKKGYPVFVHLTKQANPIELNILEATWGNWRKLVHKSLNEKNKK